MLTDQPIPRGGKLDERHDDDVGDNLFAISPVAGPVVEAAIPVVEEPAPSSRMHLHQALRPHDGRVTNTSTRGRGRTGRASFSPIRSGQGKTPPGAKPLSGPRRKHVSQRRNSQPDASCDSSPKPKEPPRLDEGAFNKALSDAKGKTRVELGGKARRRNIEDEAEASDMGDTLCDAVDIDRRADAEDDDHPCTRTSSSIVAPYVDLPQHHPFSQPHHPFSQPLSQPVFAPRLGASSSASSTSSALFPLSNLSPGRNNAKLDPEQLLNADRKRPLSSPSKRCRTEDHPASETVQRKHTGVHFEDHSMPQPSHLADKGDSHSSHQSLDERSFKRPHPASPLPLSRRRAPGTHAATLSAAPSPQTSSTTTRHATYRPSCPTDLTRPPSGSSLAATPLARELLPVPVPLRARPHAHHHAPAASAYLPGAGTSLSSPRAADARFVNAVPAAERELLQAYVMQLVVQTMAQNHGFHEDIVRRLCEETGSFAKADRRLLVMREGASEALYRFDDSDEEEGGEAGTASGVSDASNRRGSEDAAEVEGVLSQDRWLRGELPQAESTRVVSRPPAVPQRGRVSFGGRDQLHITPVAADSESSVDMEYSPPKTSRAHRHLRKGRAEEAREVNLMEMLSYGKEDWRRLERLNGPGGAKKAFGKALEKLL
ncbi:uncharacterized protein BXZ73DRAFT_79396 [Epithele typhae]|uniref:uncharacterized protein n=1 Tax=Epithele typhae TaxID=378194 RepID=UPI0020082576|nr:uncharacterized protein BXZ73DRAFT_79396 [Epithele typhae]KAH9923697.1 hypothetical protein BXZ73DRAFT_79396 [Epithele typhae]